MPTTSKKKKAFWGGNSAVAGIVVLPSHDCDPNRKISASGGQISTWALLETQHFLMTCWFFHVEISWRRAAWTGYCWGVWSSRRTDPSGRLGWTKGPRSVNRSISVHWWTCVHVLQNAGEGVPHVYMAGCSVTVLLPWWPVVVSGNTLDISALLRAMASSRSSCSCCRSLFRRSRSARSLSRLAHSNCWASFPNCRDTRVEGEFFLEVEPIDVLSHI